MSAFGQRSRRRKGPRPGEWLPVDLADVLDGLSCPYCSERTAPDDLGIFRCLCGWSGMVARVCDDPECSEDDAGLA